MPDLTSFSRKVKAGSCLSQCKFIIHDSSFPYHLLFVEYLKHKKPVICMCIWTNFFSKMHQLLVFIMCNLKSWQVHFLTNLLHLEPIIIAVGTLMRPTPLFSKESLTFYQLKPGTFPCTCLWAAPKPHTLRVRVKDGQPVTPVTRAYLIFLEEDIVHWVLSASVS